jgi:peroxiredoxin Q/BCP
MTSTPRRSNTGPLTLAIALALAAGCGRPVQRPDGSYGLLPVGADAPEVVGYDVSHNEVRLSAQRGKDVVVFFYPKDGSPGCTTEVCAYRGNWAKFEQAGIKVIGVSADSAASHDKWLKDEHLQFALASDEAGTVAQAYGVGKFFFGFHRVTFLVGPDGKVAHVWPSVDPAVNATEVLAAAASAGSH